MVHIHRQTNRKRYPIGYRLIPQTWHKSLLILFLFLGQHVLHAQTWTISTFAGTGIAGHTISGPGSTAQELNSPTGVAYDELNQRLYISDADNHCVRVVDMTTNNMTVYAGTLATPGFAGDGGPAASAKLKTPYAVAVDRMGNLYIADYGNSRIRVVDFSTGKINTMAGGGAHCSSGCSCAFTGTSMATNAYISRPDGVAVDGLGNIYISDFAGVPGDGMHIYKVDPFGVISNWAQDNSACLGSVWTVCTSGVVAATTDFLRYPEGVAVDPMTDNLYVADFGNPSIGHNQIHEIDAVTDILNGCFQSVTSPSGMALDMLGNFFYTSGTGYIMMRPYGSMTSAVIAGNGTNGYIGDCMPATASEINIPYTSFIPSGIATNSAGDVVFLADRNNHRVRAIFLTAPISGTLSTCVGSTTALSNPIVGGTWSSGATSIATVDPVSGVVYGAGMGTATITYSFPLGCYTTAVVTVSPSCSPYWNICTVAGTGTAGHAITGTGATGTELNQPTGVAYDETHQRLYIADANNHVVRMVDITTNTMTNYAGTLVSSGFSGDGGPAASAKLNHPYALALDAGGNLYIADYGNSRIRKVDYSSGIINTVAGGGAPCSSGCACAFTGTSLAVNAYISRPDGVAVDASGNIYISDFAGVPGDGMHIYKVDPSGVISNWAQSNSACLGVVWTMCTSGVPAATADFLRYPEGVAVSTAGDVYVADFGAPGYGHNQIHEIDGATNNLNACWQSVNTPNGMAFDGTDNFYYTSGDGYLYMRSYGTTTSTVIAGTGTSGYNGDCQLATSAQINIPYLSYIPSGIAVNSAGTMIFLADRNNNRVRLISNLDAPIIGASAICAGATTPYICGSPGGSWSSSATAIASVDPATGIVRGVAAGVATITYSYSVCCFTTQDITVNPLPSGVASSNSPVCEGDELDLYYSEAGDSYSWYDPSSSFFSTDQNATINPAVLADNGIFTVVATNAYGCTSSSTTNVIVNPLPTIVTIPPGIMAITVGTTVSMSGTPAGGVWSSSASSVATVDPISGVVGGVAIGSVIITYVDPDGCTSTYQFGITMRIGNISKNSSTGEVRQFYDIAPNPNNGAFTVMQYVAEDVPISIKVYNAVGAEVYNGSGAFKGGAYNLKLDQAATGLYLLILEDAHGKTYKLKFAVEK